MQKHESPPQFGKIYYRFLRNSGYGWKMQRGITVHCIEAMVLIVIYSSLIECVQQLTVLLRFLILLYFQTDESTQNSVPTMYTILWSR